MKNHRFQKFDFGDKPKTSKPRATAKPKAKPVALTESEATKMFETIQDNVSNSIRKGLVDYLHRKSDELGITGALSCCLGIAEALSGALGGIAVGAGMSDKDAHKVYVRVMSLASDIANQISNKLLQEQLGITEEQLEEVLDKMRRDGVKFNSGNWDAYDYLQIVEHVKDAGVEVTPPAGDDDDDDEPVSLEGFFRELLDRMNEENEDEEDDA